MEHIAILVLIGLAVVGVFVITAGMMGASRPAAARVSLWTWLVAVIANGAYGVFIAGIPPVNEIGAFVPIFGVPAAIALGLSRYLKS
jgi:hypothetical protein